MALLDSGLLAEISKIIVASAAIDKYSLNVCVIDCSSVLIDNSVWLGGL